MGGEARAVGADVVSGDANATATTGEVVAKPHKCPSCIESETIRTTKSSRDSNGHKNTA